MIGKHAVIFGIGQYGGGLLSLCIKDLHDKSLYHIDSPWHDGCYIDWRVPSPGYETYFNSYSSSSLYVGI
jgi:hypothetical protein